MKGFRDREYNRLMNNADDLLSNITIYEAPSEERTPKPGEEAAKGKAEEQGALTQTLGQRDAPVEGKAVKQKQTEAEALAQEEKAAERKQTGTEVLAQEEKPVKQKQTEAEALAQGEKSVEQKQTRAEALVQEEKPVEQKQTGAEALVQEEKPVEQKQTGAEALAQKEKPVKQKQTGAEALVQEEKAVEMEAVERELAEAEALVREIQMKETGLLKQEREAQTAAADDLEMDWQQEYAAKESIPALVKKEDSLFGCSLFSVVCFLYMEVILHLSIYHSIDTTIVYPLLFAAGIGCMAAVVSSFLSKGWNTVLFCVLLIVCSFYCDLQIVYHIVSGAFLSLTDIPAGISMLFQQGEAVLPRMTVALPWLVLMFLPLLLWAAAGRKWIRFEQSRWWSRLLVTAAGILVVVIGILCLDLHGYEPDSPYVCFYHFDSETQMEETGRQLGITAMTGLELMEQIAR
ncbi:MAG: hypothetical protein NC089_04685 [Bacteroides sp.]|nr:hypothetical protein [Bacteroides sp.]MCM1548691.1 hypothetical protein [Clostridium sp.]